MSEFQSSRSLSYMHPRLMSLYTRFETEMQKAGIGFIVTSTFRNEADQASLFASGRSKRGPILTNAEPGQSAHNVMLGGSPAACAFDIVILKDGKVQWDANDPLWKRAGEIGVKVGLEWAGNWQHFKEFPHFQLPNWKEIAHG